MSMIVTKLSAARLHDKRPATIVDCLHISSSFISITDCDGLGEFSSCALSDSCELWCLKTLFYDNGTLDTFETFL